MDDTARAYEAYVGRWSREIAREFVNRLNVAPRSAWLDVACGTGALTRAILDSGAAPSRIDACDLSPDRIAFAQEHIIDPRVHFRVESATALGVKDAQYDAVVSGLPFPSVPEPHAMLRELRRVLKPNGILALYVWDFAGGMQILQSFWNAATALDPNADEDDTEERFTVCNPENLQRALENAALRDVEIAAIDVSAHFQNFEEFWRPFLSGNSPAQRHVQSLDEAGRAALRERLCRSLPIRDDGTLTLNVRAWSARGRTSS